MLTLPLSIVVFPFIAFTICRRNSRLEARFRQAVCLSSKKNITAENHGDYGCEFRFGRAGASDFLPRTAGATSSGQLVADFGTDFPERVDVLLGSIEKTWTNGDAILRRLYAACQVVEILEGIASRKIRRSKDFGRCIRLCLNSCTSSWLTQTIVLFTKTD